MGKIPSTTLLKCFWSLLCLVWVTISFAQTNLKVGYAFAYTQLDETKSIFDRFNLMNPQAEKQLTPVNSYHGIELGIRYRFEHIGIELGLTSTTGNSEALNVFQEDGSLGNDDWSMTLVNYSFGLENYFGSFGYGATIGTQRLKYRTNFINADGKKTIFNESVLNSKFYFIIEVPSKSIAFSIRPYISTTWEPYNVQEVEKLFDSQSALPASDFDQNVMVYGVSFLFYNGPQRRK